MSSRAGRRARGRAKTWDPKAARRPVRSGPKTPQDTQDPRKVAYWKGRAQQYMDRVEHQSRPFTRKPDGTRVYHTREEPNRKDGRDAGRYRGMIWSQMKRPDRITLGEELYRKAKANAE